MVDVFEAKPVRRSALYSRSLSSSSSISGSGAVSKWYERHGELYEADLQDEKPSADRTALSELDNHEQAFQEQDADVYEFRLFAKPPGKSLDVGSSSLVPQRIHLKSPPPVNGEPGFVHQERPDSYYSSGDPSPEEKQNYHEAAIEGEDLIKAARLVWRGCELPWRVTTIKLPRSKQSTSSVIAADVVSSGRQKRKGKKRRIAIRTKLQAAKAREEVRNQMLAEKEATDRDKRNKRNREKKIKRREKERAKKQGGHSESIE